MFRKVLIANRGEIACRVLRTLHTHGIAGVAVFHHHDRAAPHVSLADEAVQLDSDAPAAAYLDQQQIIDIALRAGADAIHPGYGFLSENATFAQRVEEAGLAFIGPDAESMRLMGDKIRACTFAKEHGVPVAPSAQQLGDLADFVARAADIGFPLLIKAAAGGGGKGMRIVRTKAELSDCAEAAAGEAQRYFGDARIYAERYIEQPRHIEVQVLGDGQGHVVHLFERECSIQRRYQKIIEEAPAANLSVATRDALCAAAVKLAAAARYRNAGTVEFVLAPDGEFYFLEMNTRLQVEHPVTEWILGLDLVAEQLRIAAGSGLSFAQQDLRVQGHAIECRLCAEEPDHNFRPAVGRIGLLRIPEGPDIRFDGGIRQGQEITPAFDSMLGKLIVHGATRAAAVEAMKLALDQVVILGVPTNADYLARVMGHAAFMAGRLHTGFVVEYADALSGSPASVQKQAAALVAAALHDVDFRRTAFGVPEPYASMGGWRN
jgi:propionyl-CoA carboxylase alpha chain/3-methylcrotonyl-CoA carboxylase alpha subunit/acetyl-CoA/propionyl-CoA carboxylase biotin carboxyl carrier protein